MKGSDSMAEIYHILTQGIKLKAKPIAGKYRSENLQCSKFFPENKHTIVKDVHRKDSSFTSYAYFAYKF